MDKICFQLYPIGSIVEIKKEHQTNYTEEFYKQEWMIKKYNEGGGIYSLRGDKRGTPLQAPHTVKFVRAATVEEALGKFNC